MYRWRRICDQRNWVNYSIVYRLIEMDVFVCVSKRIDHIFGVESCKHKAIRSRISVKRFSFYFPQVKLKGSLFVQRPVRRLNCWIFCCVNIFPLFFVRFGTRFRNDIKMNIESPSISIPTISSSINFLFGSIHVYVNNQHYF